MDIPSPVEPGEQSVYYLTSDSDYSSPLDRQHPWHVYIFYSIRLVCFFAQLDHCEEPLNSS